MTLQHPSCLFYHTLRQQAIPQLLFSMQGRTVASKTTRYLRFVIETRTVTIECDLERDTQNLIEREEYFTYAD